MSTINHIFAKNLLNIIIFWYIISCEVILQMSENETKMIAVKKEENKKEKSFIRECAEWVICILTAFFLAVIIKYFIFTPTLVMQTSMTPTIQDGERVLINRIVRTCNLDINRGDIITFEKPDFSDNGIAYYNKITNLGQSFVHNVLELTKISYIKRVIGLPGEHLEIRDGKVYVNGEVLDEPYLKEGLLTPRTGYYGDIDVPEGYLFVMGDNRTGSTDSREFGCIPISKVEGRVKIRIWPLTALGKIDQ